MKKAAALLTLGLMQMAGDVLRIPVLKGIGAASAASPAPKVFSAVRGLETYSTRFSLEWTDRSGGARRLALTPELYAGLRGPYNRRNAYGAVTAYGPIFLLDSRTKPMFEAVSRYALCGNAPLLRELGGNPSDVQEPIRVRLDPLAQAPSELARVIEIPCADARGVR